MTTFRFLLKAHALRVGAGLLAAVALLLLADFVELAPALGRQPQWAALALDLYLHKLPGLALQALPLALLFGVLLTVADQFHHRELLALQSAGAGAVRLALPPILLAAVLAGGALWAARGPIPRATQRVVRLETESLGRWNWYWTVFHTRRSWYRGEDGRLVQVGAVLDDGRRLEGVTVYQSREGRLVRLGTADTLVWTDGGWRGQGVTVWAMDPADPGAVTVSDGPLPVEVRPEHFGGILGQPEELPAAELDRAIALRRAQGRSTLAMEVERSGRTAMPLLGLALTVLALGLTLGVRPPATAGGAAMVGIVVAFAGWMLLALTRALGLAGVLAPGPAAWLPVAVPAALGVGLLALGSRFRVLSRFRR